MTQLPEIIKKVKTLASECGKFIRDEADNFNIDNVKVKGLNDFVSDVDLNAEKILVRGLADILPEAGFITEEGTSTEENRTLLWVIDPLDGTTNFIHGLPPYSISIGLRKGEEIIAGVVYVISSDEMFYGWKDGGSWLNNRRISVSNAGKISDMLVATGFPFKDYDRLDSYLKCLRYFISNTHGVRRLGSAAVDLAYVACGRFDGFFEYNLNPWDITAGTLLIREAGGIVTDFKGIGKDLTGEEIIASNPAVFNAFQTAVGEFMNSEN